MFKTTFQPQLVAASVWIAPNATVVGDVELSDESSVWFGAVIRGDTEWIRVGKRSNIQDLVCLHADHGVPCTIGEDTTIGHSAVVHGAAIGNNVLIGIRAVVLNGAVIGDNSLVAAGAVVLEGQNIPPRSLVAGVPARIIRELTDFDIARIQHAAQHYTQAAAAFLA
jgi:carbonic anhydrase/acetyltransferase-like protein (isoleucine patch superfamily)